MFIELDEIEPDASLEAQQLSAVGTRVGADLTPESVRLPDLQFKVAIILSYDGSPLGEIAFVDPRGAPVLFCVIANGAADAPMRSKRRGERSLSRLGIRLERLARGH